MLRLMGHHGRLMVLCHLMQGEQTVGVLESRLGLSQSALSQHLAKLRADGLVKTRKEGLHVHYSLASEQAAAVLRALYDIYCRTGLTTI